MSATTLANRNAQPFNPIQKEFDTMLSQLFNPPTTNRVSQYLAPYGMPYGVDVREDADHLIVEADLPGFKKDEVEITLEDQTLTIAAERKTAAEQPAGEWLLNERRAVRFQRRFKLPQTVGDQSVNAKLEDGVLTITLAKREESKPRRISVQ
jgi:HSP20 family protein